MLTIWQVQASHQANTFAISGQAETKQVSEMLPSIVNQLGPEGFASLRKLAMEKVGEESKAAPAKDDDVPELEGDFEQASKQEEEQSKAVSIAYYSINTLKNQNLHNFSGCRVNRIPIYRIRFFPLTPDIFKYIYYVWPDFTQQV